MLLEKCTICHQIFENNANFENDHNFCCDSCYEIVFKRFNDELRLKLLSTYNIIDIDTTNYCVIVENMHRRINYHISMTFNGNFFQISFENYIPIRMKNIILAIIRDINKIFCHKRATNNQIYIEKKI